MTRFGCWAPLGPGSHLAGIGGVSGSREGMGPAEGERLAGPSKGLASCWNHCPGAVASSDTSWVRRDRWRLQSVGGRWWMVMAAAALVSGHIYAGLLAWQGEAGKGWSAGVCPVCNGSPARSWSPGQSPSPHGRGRAGGRGRRRAPEPGPAAAGTWGAIPGTKASTTREGTGARGSSPPLEHRDGEARWEDACGDLGGSHRRGDPPPRAPVPRTEGLLA